MKSHLLVSVAALLLAGAGSATASDVFSFSDASSGSLPVASAYVGAKPLKLPTVKQVPFDKQQTRSANGKSPGLATKPSFRKGFAGGDLGEMVQIMPDTEGGANLPPARQLNSPPSGIGTMAYGDAGIPFSTSRVELNPRSADVTKLYPYRAAGRLFFKMSDGSATCSAALIDKGLLLTAAHCVTDFGGPQFSGFTFIPGYHKGKGAYGTFRASRVYVKASYAAGTDVCTQGVVCKNDVAIIVLKPNAESKYPGELTGWYSIAWDGYGFTPDGETHVTQLGYPGSLDNGSQMIRNDSMGYANQGRTKNTVLGSSMDGGSSGGPWVVNLGSPPRYTIDSGQASDPNVIIGATSWGYDDGGVYLMQGSSPFTSSNVGALLTQACRNYPAACTIPP
jgi:V8-like Glu-specific endopeptidase